MKNRASPLFLLFVLFGWLICLPAMAQVEIDGHLEGILSGIYIVNGDIWVESGDSLTIMPGTELQFDGQYSFTIYGYLCAVGIETDSIKFIPKAGILNWSGMKFNSADDFSRLDYCLITGSNDHGILMNAASPTISHSTISGNSTLWHGGGIRCENGSMPVISNCVINNNQTGNYGYCYGGGIALDSSDATIYNCIINGNTAYTHGGGISCWYSDATIQDCQIFNNTLTYPMSNEGGGIYTYVSNVIIQGCNISNNHLVVGYGTGGGICNYGDSTTTVLVENCVIIENSASNGAGGINNCGSVITINKCIISDNIGVGIVTGSQSTLITHSTISGNVGLFQGNSNAICCVNNCLDNSLLYMTNTIVENNTGSNQTIFIYDTDSVNIGYCDFYNNQGRIFAGQTIPQLGTISTTNANGDSCDVFYNIYLDPQFVTNGNYNLQATSPCIDAGDPTFPLDPDSTIADIGAFYYDQLVNVAFQPQPLPTEFWYLTNYPNPFNSSTNLVFNLPTASTVSLTVYNIAGEKITDLVDNAFLTAGKYDVHFDGSILSSGIYFATLRQGGFETTKKLLLIK